MKEKSIKRHEANVVVLEGIGIQDSDLELPLFSSRPQAGFPAPGDDLIEKVLDINDLVVKHPASTFFVRVEGDSMQGAKIFDGDVLVVDRSVTPKDRSIVVAAIYGATAETYYCFRMVDVDGTKLDIYSNYPQIRTSSFTPKSQNWRFYDDETNETPSTPLANENVTPVDITNGQIVKLRVTVKETENISRDDVRFKLQYSEYANFSIPFDVVASSTCLATSTWCYADGGGVDNAVISTKVISDADSCASGIGDGCGTHNESSDNLTGFRHKGGASTEYEFTIKSAGPRVNQIYYFRLYGLAQDIPVFTNSGESYPSLATEGASLQFTMDAVASSTVIAGVTLDIDTTPTSVPFGKVPLNTFVEGAHRLVVDSNGTQGHQILMAMDGDLVSSSGVVIKQISSTNAAPSAWSAACHASSTSCFGYHTTDATLQGDATRFSAIDTYARLSTTTPEEVSYSSQPVTGETTDIVFRILVRDLQDAGLYENNIRYISVPMF
ncbi:MAG: hypothetical protein K9M10_01970 [Candidatus Pacebacteria bacterium]|nr:hypothetical protein [Candidatus Paceibacterota bacterium]MCF7857231.1 hypothetical protein [Candidatus Paceibacterota bacterium]